MKFCVVCLFHNVYCYPFIVRFFEMPRFGISDQSLAVSTRGFVVFLIFFQINAGIISPDGGPGRSVGIATDYGLEVPGSNPGGDEVFRQSRPALGPTQPPVKCCAGSFPGGKVRPGRAFDHSPPSSAAVMEE